MSKDWYLDKPDYVFGDTVVTKDNKRYKALYTADGEQFLTADKTDEYDHMYQYDMCSNHDLRLDDLAEIMQSDIAVEVELFDCDLTRISMIKAVVQGNVQDTKLKTLSRSLLTFPGTCKSGMYIKYKNRFWLIIGLVDDNGMYEKAVLVLCNHLLTWLNDKDEVVQRWVNITSASQYNNGETENKNFTLQSDQLLVLSPNDDECVLINNGKRFVIDKRCQIYEKNFDGEITIDTSRPLTTYEVTRVDSVLFDYQDSGHHEFMLSQREQHNTDGYYVIDGKGYWLCDIPTETDDKTVILSSSIACDSNKIYVDLEPGVFTAKFYDADGNEVNATPQWEIDCDFLDDLDIEYVDNSILISVNNEKLVNKSFQLLLSCDGYEPTSIVITIKAFL